MPCRSSKPATVSAHDTPVGGTSYSPRDALGRDILPWQLCMSNAERSLSGKVELEPDVAHLADCAWFLSLLPPSLSTMLPIMV